MKRISRSFKIGHEYVDDIANSKEKDQFVKWLPGIGNSGGIRPVKFKNITFELPSFIVLITRQTAHRHHNPWDDIIDYMGGKIYYWGDAKYDINKSYIDFGGNKILMKCFEAYLNKDFHHIPPILHFSKERRGKVIFNGLCVLKKLELTWYEDKGKPIKNFRCELDVLDEYEVDVNWLIERSNLNLISDINFNVPKVWMEFTRGKIKKIEVFKKEIKSKDQQLPPENSDESKILQSLIQLTPTQFEAVLVEIFKGLPHIHHNITRTRPVKDEGFDFYGDFSLPFPLGYKIPFLGEAKKYNRNNGIGPDKVSRLVARLDRGQFGIFVTTSYYTKQTQTEVLEDGYPIKLYSGIDLINFLRELRLIEGNKISSGFIDTIIQSMQ